MAQTFEKRPRQWASWPRRVRENPPKTVKLPGTKKLQSSKTDADTGGEGFRIFGGAGRGRMPLKWQTRNPFSWCQRQHTNSKLQQQPGPEKRIRGRSRSPGVRESQSPRVGATLGAINYAASGRCCNLMPSSSCSCSCPCPTAFNLNHSASLPPWAQLPWRK